MNKVLVIGASGYMGRHIVKAMIGSGVEVYALEHRSPLPDDTSIKVIKGGISAINSKLIDTLKPDAIFHLARPTLPRWRKAGRLMAARYAAILNKRLIRELESSQGNPSLVFASGSLMYGSSPLPHDEDAPLHPISYARQYYRGEMPIIKAVKSGKITVKAVRIPWLLGKGSWFEWFYLRTMQQYKAIPLFGDGNNRMEIIDINDAARLIIKIANEHSANGIYNLITAGAVTQLEFTSALSAISGLPVKDYREIFPAKIEKEALEAFTSNIVLETKFPDISAGFQFTSLEETLGKMIPSLTKI